MPRLGRGDLAASLVMDYTDPAALERLWITNTNPSFAGRNRSLVRSLRKAWIQGVSRHLLFEPSIKIAKMIDHLFFYNLRSYDRLNKTPAIVRQEEISGVPYQDVQRAEAHEIMGESIRRSSDSSESSIGDHDRRRIIDQKRKFEAKKEEAAAKDPVTSVDSIAEHAMLGESRIVDEPWEGDPEAEKENFVQEELYIHSKVSSWASHLSRQRIWLTSA